MAGPLGLIHVSTDGRRAGTIGVHGSGDAEAGPDAGGTAPGRAQIEGHIMTPHDIRDRLIAQRVLPVLRLESAGAAERAFECLLQAGFAAIEITMTVPGATGLIERLAARALPGVVIGAGTVLDLDAARRCMDAGARFLASPCVVPEMIRMAHPAGCAVLQGAYTPGEVLAAHREGADIVKVFPASSGGPDHLRALHAVLPDVLLCPAGGISLLSVEVYLAAGAALVCVGSNILDRRALAAGDAASVIAHARQFLAPSEPAAAPGARVAR
jgi:2-dehydro-3-deoxyphosphogluconate aldolase/(4S)-4-hydroxy-2-oxoglutarate aldolase